MRLVPRGGRAVTLELYTYGYAQMLQSFDIEHLTQAPRVIVHDRTVYEHDGILMGTIARYLPVQALFIKDAS